MRAKDFAPPCPESYLTQIRFEFLDTEGGFDNEPLQPFLPEQTQTGYKVDLIQVMDARQSSQSSLSSLPYATLPLLTRICYHVILLGFRTFFRVFLTLRSILKSPIPGTLPTLIKSYPPTLHLKNRIFYPPTYTSSAPLPLYLSLHGGAFAFGDPSLDDTVNAKVCSDWNVLVISLAYPTSVRYPVPTQQLVATILSILADDSLPFDSHRVAIGGFSAGGQLALSACLDPQLKGKIHAVTPFYPVTDFTIGATERKDTRPYRYEGEVDKLLKIIPLSIYSYVPAGQDLRAPSLSPRFSAREELPEWICTVGAELDILGNEAGAMMGRLAGKELVKVGETEGLGGQDRDGFEADGGRLKWVFVKGARHGFTHQRGASKEDPAKANKDSDEAFRIVGEWLLSGPFNSGNQRPGTSDCD
jgi:acetyl esterase/lipase